VKRVRGERLHNVVARPAETYDTNSFRIYQSFRD
jgi:hypothetical protein